MGIPIHTEYGHHLTETEVRQQRLRLAREMVGLLVQDSAGLPKPLRTTLADIQERLRRVQEALQSSA